MLIRERFKPLEYFPLIFLFVGVNYLFTRSLSGLELPLGKLLILLVLGAFFFFRMRLFDELKDYEVDLRFNPTRPLARGLLTTTEVRRGIFVLLMLEFILAFSLGTIPFLLYVLAVAYTLLMFEEFFIGDFLRPRLTTYAVTHTVVVSFLSLSMMSANLGLLVFESPAPFLMALSHWFVFNLFEFARKTFGPLEERAEVPSYSKIFSLKGAYLLSVSQVVLALWILFFLRQLFITRPLLALGAIYAVLLIPGVIRPREKSAKLFRSLSTLYLSLHFLILFIILYRS